MQIYNVYQSGKRLYIDEKENPDNKIVVNKYDNMQQTLRLISDGTLPPRLYWALRNPKLSNKYFILKLVNNEDLIVGTDISAYAGLWDMLLIGTDEDYIIEGTDIDQSRLTYVSDHFGRLFVRDNFLEELDFEEQCSPTFRVFYDEIMFRLDNIPDLSDIPDKLSDLENDTNFISGVALKDDGEGNVKIIGTTFEGSETEEGGGGNYNLPVANEITLGGVKPLNKTEDMTLDVGVDKNGRLFAKGKDITVDSELDKESQNPVQNKVITAEVKALREENEALEQKNSKLEEKNAELESSIEKLQIKTTTDPSSFHHITDSANMKVLDFGMEGITEQRTVPGNQLFDISKYVSNSTSTNNGDGSITLTRYAVEGTNKLSDLFVGLEVGKTIIFNMKNAGLFVFFGGTPKEINKPFEITQDMLDNNLFGFYGKADTSADNPLTMSDIMCNEGTTAFPVEEYVGCMPSPNPDYEQPITLAGVYNEETGRYEIGCGFISGNIMSNNWEMCKTISWGAVVGTEPSIYDMNHKSIMEFDVISNTKVCFHNDTTDKYWLDRIVELDEEGNGLENHTLYYSLNYNYSDYSFQILPNTKKLLVEVALVDNTKTFTEADLEEMKIAFGYGDSVSFTPHASQPFTLTSDRPLTKWDNLVKRDGVYGYSICSFEEIHDANNKGADVVSVQTNTNGDKYFILEDLQSKYSYPLAERVDLVSGTSLSDSFIENNPYSTSENCMWRRIDQLRIRIDDESVMDKNTLNTWIAEHPFKVVYKTQEEQVFIPLPDEEQELLRNLETYYGVTNVYNEQGCPMWLTYIVDNQLYFDNKIEEINNALLSLGANI